MANQGKVETEIELKSNADNVWSTIIRDYIVVFPKAFPNDYKSIEILEGDIGKVAGVVFKVTYGEGSPLVKTITKRVDVFDDSQKTLTYSVIDGDPLNYFKKLKGHLSVIPKGDGSIVKWSSEYEDSQGILEPEIFIKEIIIKFILKIDDYILNA